VWDHDLITANDFIGEATVPLAILMDGRMHQVKVKLEDPDSLREEGSVQGFIQVELRYGS
jgi:hypothetical protein